MFKVGQRYNYVTTDGLKCFFIVTHLTDTSIGYITRGYKSSLYRETGVEAIQKGTWCLASNLLTLRRFSD